MRAEATSYGLGSMEDADNAEDGAFFVGIRDKTLEVCSGDDMDDVGEGSNDKSKQYIKIPV